jgi:RNA polymerase sigma-70 factor (ECF subfamily)
VNDRALSPPLPRSAPEVARAPAPTDAQEDARHFVHELFERQASFVWRAVRGLGVPQAQLDDAVQDVFLVAHRRHADFRRDTSERAWLFQIARHVARNCRRTVRRKGGLLPLEESMQATSSPSPHEQVARQQALQVLLAFLERLDEPKREVFVLIELAELSAQEAADALGVKLNTVYSRLRLAREQWQRAVRQAGNGDRHD